MTKLKELLSKELASHALWLVGTILILVLLFWFFDVEQIRVWVLKAGVWGPLIFIVAKASTLVIAPISGSAIYPMAGAIFGFEKGFLYVFIGDALGSTIAFMLSRYFGRRIVERFLGTGDYKYIDHILHHLNSWRGLIEARIFFAALPEAVAYAAGLSKLPFFKFFIVQMTIAIIPSAILVKFGSLFAVSENPFLMGAALAAGTIAMILGGAFFMLQVRKRALLNEQVEK